MKDEHWKRQKNKTQYIENKLENRSMLNTHGTIQ